MTKVFDSRASDRAVYERAYKLLMTAEPSAEKIAARVGLSSRQAVVKWRWRGVPWEHMDALEAAYGIPRWQLNPIIYRNPLHEVARWGPYFAQNQSSADQQAAA